MISKARTKAETCSHWYTQAKHFRFYRASGTWKRRIYCE